MSEQQAGAVVALWRYPVKSMQGEPLDAAELGAGGVAGDRAYALIDVETGAVVSAKHPRKWPALLACSAAFVAPPRAGAPPPPVRITLPDGASVRSDDPEVDRALSRAFGRAVRLAAQAPAGAFREADRSTPGEAQAAPAIRREPLALGAPAGSFFDYGPIHALTTATLAQIAALAPGSVAAPQRFRPNLLIASPEGAAGFVEHAWPGRALALGADVTAQVIDPCPRCVVTTLAQGELPRDPAILRALTAHSAAPSATLAPGVVFPAVAGVYIRVTRPGLLRVGARAELI